MNPQRWQTINEIFQAAVELPDSQREAYLRERCAGDEELRAEIAAVLAKYVSIDVDAIEIQIDTHRRDTQLVVSSAIAPRNA